MTESTLQSGILTSSLPIIKEINGTKVMIFQGYDSERSELNRTVLQYSVCKNGSWTTPKAVLDDGYADMVSHQLDQIIIGKDEWKVDRNRC